MYKKWFKKIFLTVSILAFSILFTITVSANLDSDECEHIFKVNCVEGGRASCIYCGKIDKANWYEPKEHTLTEIGHQEPADCFGGHIFYKCEDCDNTVSVYYEDPKYPHTWKESERVNATCSSEGYIDYYCDYCHRGGKREILPATNEHNYCWISNQDATCTTDGTKTAHCQVCDYESTNIMVDEGSALGHDFNEEWSVLTESTCSQSGVSIKICKRCLEIETLIESAYGHTDKNSDNKCDDCSCLLSSETIPNEFQEPEQPKKTFFLIEFFNNILNFFKKIFNISHATVL